ncbi:hypothetical protein [Piscinibacterium candidicorallinum]|uniref:Cyclophilin TM1367-like domain-containing protein n=1 Tax=Piscinibacterium candidicorallinum TaxID=1793872 RepID=A0ABV7H762_9BURK
MRIHVVLQDGTHIEVEELCLSVTYVGLLEGEPDSARTRLEKEDCIDWARRIEPADLPVTCFGPEWGQAGTTRLPPVRFAAMVTSEQPVDSVHLLSWAKIAWFGTLDATVPIQDVLRRSLSSLAWRKVAKGYDI